MKNKKTPVLLLVFNRPETTSRAFAEIKKYMPEQLFVAADGPRNNKFSEAEKCEKARKITESIDWPCKVKRLYRDNNLGSKIAPSSAIDWFFRQVKEGIILEDDCVPGSSFFRFCESMLGKYRNNKKVFHIGGDNFLPLQKQDSGGYYLSKYPNTWGWATWRRAWRHYDVEMKSWPSLAAKRILKKYCVSYWEKKYWSLIFNQTFLGKNDAWDYQWVYTIWANDALSVTPGVNLVENIGLNRVGTHVNTNNRVLGVKARNINSNPKLLGNVYSKLADEYASKNVYRTSPIMVFAQWTYYLLKSIKV